VLPIHYFTGKMFLQSMNTEMVSLKEHQMKSIKLSSTYFDDINKTSKLLILISDGEDHSEGAKQRQKKRISRE
jgi:Ca-activated chloride channel family protein